MMPKQYLRRDVCPKWEMGMCTPPGGGSCYGVRLKIVDGETCYITDHQILSKLTEDDFGIVKPAPFKGRAVRD